MGLVFALVVKFELQDSAKAAAFDQLVAETVRDIAEHESGTLVYATHVVEGEPLARVFYEVYRDRAAFDEHERQPHTRRFLERRGEFVADFRVEFLTPGVAKGIAGA
ncbi:putative quinol monooxygenase [Nocardia cyriacigeorgica]|uniref:putative quinol monooxygenase n=1 Tax=Nocardia cyriacigeorgica TaxID=135487 RepID=UPI002B4B9611|nr:antibiotic biosynthesis monooxygenase [Nocardia cyriacigeorgica]